MINKVWFFLIGIGVIFAIFTGRIEIVSQGIVNSTSSAVELIIKLCGMMCLWCGVMKIAYKSGLTEKLARVLRPILNLIFKGEGKSKVAMEAIIMNLTANIMGLSNAATPAGIKALEEMQRLNPHKDRATDDMAIFLVLNTACIQLVPTTVISIRAACNSSNPAMMILPAIISTVTAAICGVLFCKLLQKYF
ncbi:MAG: nucleoside recognition domain-containing protein [Clostridium sp.]